MHVKDLPLLYRVYTVTKTYFVARRLGLQWILGGQNSAADHNTQQDEVAPVVVRAHSPTEHAKSTLAHTCGSIQSSVGVESLR